MYVALSILILHNILFLNKISLIGDNIDYTLFSLEYLVLCYVVFALPHKLKISYKIFRILGFVAMSLGYVIGFVGIWMFIVISQDFASDRHFYHRSGNYTYETRRYSMGFVTFVNTRYTFETYREYTLLPIEIKVDKTDFFDDQTTLYIRDSALKIAIIDTMGGKRIVFSSANGRTFSKRIHASY